MLRLSKCERQILGRLKPVGGLLFQAACHNVPDGRRDRLRKLWRVLLEDRGHRFHFRVSMEEALASQKLMEDEAEIEDIGAVIQLLAANLLGRHVPRRA